MPRDEPPPLTPAQELYLESFDSFLLAKSDGERLAHRQQMGTRLNFVLSERGMPLPVDTRWADSWHDRRPAWLFGKPRYRGRS